MKNQNGFSSTTLLVLLPLILSLLVGGSYLGRNLFEWNRLHHICQIKALDHQNELRNILNKLLSLNPRAKKLLVQEAAAQAALVAATATGAAPAIVAATKRLEQIKAQQLILRIEQQSILALAQVSSRKFKWSFLLNFPHANKKILHHPSGPSYPLAVQARPPHATAPEYLPTYRFEDRQAFHLIFEWESLKIQCGSTLREENGKWYTHLSAAKL